MPHVNPAAGKVVIQEASPILISAKAPNLAAAKKVADWWMGPAGNARVRQDGQPVPRQPQGRHELPAPGRRWRSPRPSRTSYRILNRYWEGHAHPDLREGGGRVRQVHPEAEHAWTRSSRTWTRSPTTTGQRPRSRVQSFRLKRGAVAAPRFLARAPEGSLKTRDTVISYLFILPAFVLVVVLLVVPMFQNIYYSFFKWNGLGIPAVHRREELRHPVHGQGHRRFHAEHGHLGRLHARVSRHRAACWWLSSSPA